MSEECHRGKEPSVHCQEGLVCCGEGDSITAGVRGTYHLHGGINNCPSAVVVTPGEFGVRGTHLYIVLGLHVVAARAQLGALANAPGAVRIPDAVDNQP